MTNYITKDSGQRQEYESGMRRDLQTGKMRLDLIYQPGLQRVAELYTRGAEKYGDNNWQLANSEEELKRFRSSAYRHFFQWFNHLEPEEDHMAAVIFNLFAAEYLEKKLQEKKLAEKSS